MASQQLPDVIYTLPGTERVSIRQVPYRTTAEATSMMDIYYPPDLSGDTRLPAVIFVFGYPDPAAIKLAGTPLKDMPQYLSWGRLVAASGMVAITYNTWQPSDDLDHLVQYVRDNSESLQIDLGRLGLWSCSGNVPVAMTYAMGESGAHLRFAVLYYGVMPMRDNEDRESMVSLANERGFHLTTVSDLRTDLPLYVVRAGQDQVPTVNDSIDRFVSGALAANIPMTLVNYASGAHGFDTDQDTGETRSIIRQTIRFMLDHI